MTKHLVDTNIQNKKCLLFCFDEKRSPSWTFFSQICFEEKKAKRKMENDFENQVKPKIASAFRLKDVMLFQNQHPARIVAMKTSKTGKHGSCKIVFVGIHIFTAKKYQDMSPSTHNLYEVIVKKDNYQVLCFNEDGTLELINDDDKTGPTVDLKDVEPITADKLKCAFETREEDEDLWVTILQAMGKTTIQDFKLQNSKK
jgi:translation initiation factor 5A